MKKFYPTLYTLIFLAGILIFNSGAQAQVLPGDSTALVALYDSTGGSTWTNHTNWLAGNVPTWYGVTVRNNRVYTLNLSSNNLTGATPYSVTGLDSLHNLNLSYNTLTSFPALTAHLDSLSLQGNNLTFKDLIPNRTAADSFYYVPQDSVDIAIDTTVAQQSSITLTAQVDNHPIIDDNYQWMQNGITVSSGPSYAYTMVCVDTSNAGIYECVITNLQLPRLTLYRRLIDLHVTILAQVDSSFQVCDSMNTLSGLAAPVGGSVLWSVVSGIGVIADDSAAVTAVAGLSVGTNVFQYSVSAGNISCPAGTYSTALLTITRDTNPSPAYAGPNISVCGAQAVLSADSPSVGIGTWTVISLGSAVVAQPNTPNTVANGLSYGVNIFRWQIVNGACAPAYFSEVKVFRDDTLSNVSAGRDTSICPTSYLLTAPLPADAHWTWSVAGGSGIFAQDTSNQLFENDTVINIPVSGLSGSTNTFMWTVSNTCNAVSADVHVTVYPFTMANAGPDEQIYYSPIYPFILGDSLAVGTGGNGQYNYVWSPATNLDSADVEHPQFLTPDAGTFTYSVTVTDGHGCTASAAVTLTVVKNEFLAVPTLFTPNGDGVNDVLYIPGIEGYPDNVLTVVDRNAQLVYKKKGYTNDWGGINELGFAHEGQLLPPDTYFYTLNLADGKPTQTGYFLIKY